MQRILVELIGAGEDLVEQGLLALDVANEERLGEFAFVLEMIEESALGDADGGDQLLDRGGRESLVENRRFGRMRMRSRVSPPFRSCASCMAVSPVTTLPRVQLTRGA
jgi:hypothetical protein